MDWTADVESDHSAIIGSHSHRRRWLASWLELLRLPNLFTVPGDPLVGHALALAATGMAWTWSPRLLLVPLPSVLLYMAGLVQNDLCDLAEDRRERPQRPLPSGRVRKDHTRVVAIMLAGAGLAIAASLGSAAGLTALALVGTITLYNAAVKHRPLAGPLAMGACRGLSLLLGAAASGVAGMCVGSVWIAAAGATAFVAGITAIAARETETFSGGTLRWLPAAAIAVWLAAMIAAGGAATVAPNRLPLVALVAGLALAHTLRCALDLQRGAPPAVVQRTVGALIRSLLPMQAALVIGHGTFGLGAALALLAAWPLAYVTSRRLYAS